MNRRSFHRAVAAGAVSSVLSNRNASGQSAPANPAWPREVAGIRTVDSKYAKLALETLVHDSPAFLVNHAARTFYFGALVGQAQKMKFDMELLFLACALHDLGLTEAHMGPLPFEIQGAEAAKRILTAAGLEAEKAEIVWDGIAMHPLAISGFKRPEIALVSAGAGADVLGGGLDELSKDHVSAVLAAFPRLGFKGQFVKTCAHVVERYPRGAGRTFMMDIGQREVPSFKVRNICDAIAAAPFAD